MAASYSNDKPRLDDDDVMILQDHYYIKIGDYASTVSTRPCPTADQMHHDNMLDQNRIKALSQLPYAYAFIKPIMDIPLDDLLQFVWSNGDKGVVQIAQEMIEDDRQMISIIKYIFKSVKRESILYRDIGERGRK